MIRLGDWEMRRELVDIWQICFDEPARPPKYFLNNYFRPENCLVYQVGEKIAAVVYLLPARIAAKKGTVQAHYIYAAATLPEYRSRGFMAALLAAAALVGARRGDQYSFLLPATKELYPMYQKSDYRPFFKARMADITLDQLVSIAESGQINKTALSIHHLNSLRSGQLAGKTGSVLWSHEAFAFAAGMGKIYGDKLVASLTDGQPAYALCRRLDENTCLVQEIMAQERTLPNLAANLIQTMPALSYRFRLPANSALLQVEGEELPSGMMKPIGGASMEPVEPISSAPYLGLPLD